MSYSKKLLLRTRDLFVKELSVGSNTTVICFTPWIRDIPRNEKNNRGFGEGIFIEKGYNELHILARYNHWYQINDVVDFLIKYKNHNTHKFFTYGSSMGGFAAIVFAPLVNGRCIAISPQFSISPEVVPFEQRWRQEASSVEFIYNISYNSHAQGLLVYDSISDDAKHARLILMLRPSFLTWKKPFLGHPAGKAINELIGIKQMILDYIEHDHNINLTPLNNAYHAYKKNHSWYWENLAYQFLKMGHKKLSPTILIELDNASKRFPDSYYLNRLVYILGKNKQ